MQIYIYIYIYMQTLPKTAVCMKIDACLRSFLVDLFVPKIKLRERERVMYKFVRLKKK